MSPVVPLLVLCLVAVVGVSIWAQRTFLREVRGLHERVAELEVRLRHSDEDRGYLQERVREVERMVLQRDMEFLQHARGQLDRALAEGGYSTIVGGAQNIARGTAVREPEKPPSVKADTPPAKPPPSLYERIGKDEDDP